MKRLILSGLCACLTLPTFANSEYNDWLKQNTMDMGAAKQEFQDYMDANDKAFLGFLKQQWKEVDVKKPELLDTKPKPRLLPTAPKPVDKPITSKPISKPVIVAAPIIPKPKPDPTPKPIAQQPDNTVNVKIFAHNVAIYKDANLKQSFTGNMNSDSIANFYSKLAKHNHDNAIKDLQTKAKELRLNPWGTAVLFHYYIKTLGINDHNAQQLTTWYLLVKAGFDARVAYNQNAFLLMPSKQALYGVTYFTFTGTRYYAVSLDGKQLNTGRAYTYSGKHADAKHPLDFTNSQQLLPSANHQKKQLSFQYQGQNHTLTLSYDIGQIELANTTPQLNISQYAHEGLPENTANELLSQLAPMVESKSEQDAVNLLLRFVQTAFNYKTDEQQFQQENYLYPIETLHYPYSDCEDRASLFAWLVKGLLKLDTVLLDYPGHIAAAVAFNSDTTGDSWMHNGKRYTVTDPTYINASLGMTMPNLKVYKPKIVAF
ncbi:hypothetical protein NBRC116188_22500 [Oceaniserpentilla sp. 4NH20-0058]|uniref:hypothetical protein n=1 Tax=Oceaniserpentilla sp. 4NH20-0058 TaxID=3127660 RepID=UPI00310A42B0